MNTTSLVARARYSAFIGNESFYSEYTQDRILEELTDRLRSVFSDAVVKARSGYWLADYVETTTTGSIYIPPRAVVGGMESVAFLYQGQYWPLDAVTDREADAYASTTSDYPLAYYADTERVRVIPAPTSAQTLRIRYYLRPSQLVRTQSAGKITSINAAARSFVVNSLPLDEVTSTTLLSGDSVDIIRPAGWFSPLVVSEACSISGLTVTLAGMSEADFVNAVAVGHYVRSADQTEWPAIPEDFHRLVADAAAVKILMEMGLSQKAQELSASATAEFQRLIDLINPRTKADPKKVRLRPYWMRGGLSW